MTEPASGTSAVQGPRIRAVLTDFDNTIYDFEGAYALAVENVARKLARFGVERQELLATYSILRGRDFSKGAANGREVRTARINAWLKMWPATLSQDAREWTAELERSFCSVVAMPEANRNALQYLLARANLCIVTESWEDLQRACIQALGIPGDIPLIASYSAGVRKADGSAYKLALEQLRARPHEAVMVGDHWEADVIAASRLGIATVYVGNPLPADPPAGFIGAVDTFDKVVQMLGQYLPKPNLLELK